MKPKFAKGDRVVGIKNFDGNMLIRGTKGTILYQHRATGAEHAFYAVAFDECVDGHDCGGRCKKTYGWNVPSTHLKKIKK